MTKTKSKPLSASCTLGPRAYHQSGSRPLSDIRLLVLHSTEGPVGVNAAKDVAQYFSTPAAGGSAHVVIDDQTCYRCLPNTIIPWAAPDANANGVHFEMCGYAAWTKLEWLRHLPTIKRTAYKVAQHAHAYGIPLEFVKAPGLIAGKTGVTTHREVSAYGLQANLAGDHSHTDPGTGFPMGLFLWYAKRYLKQVKAASK